LLAQLKTKRFKLLEETKSANQEELRHSAQRTQPQPRQTENYGSSKKN